jgi:hypothetical protein
MKISKQKKKKKRKQESSRKKTYRINNRRDDRNKLRDEEEAPGSTHPPSSSLLLSLCIHSEARWSWKDFSVYFWVCGLFFSFFCGFSLFKKKIILKKKKLCVCVCVCVYMEGCFLGASKVIMDFSFFFFFGETSSNFDLKNMISTYTMDFP